MTARGRHRRPRRRQSIAASTALVLCLIAVSGYFRLRADRTDALSRGAPVPSSSTTSSSPSTSPKIIGVATATGASTPRTATTPVHLTIPSIGVSTDLESLKLLANGALQTPSQWDVAGWYTGGVVPGQIGPAVIAGHVDSTRGPAVFYRLHALVAGATILVAEQSGTVLSFVVDRVQVYPKDHFPTTTVYGPAPIAELRLITCAGEFDRRTGNYLSNLVVLAHLT